MDRLVPQASLRSPTTCLRELCPHLEEHVHKLVEELLQKELLRMERGALQRPSPLWTVQDLAAYLNVSPRTVETLIADGAFRPIWVGRQRRFQPQAIEAYLRRQVG